MKRLVLLVVLVSLAACRARFGGEATGTATSDAAVQQFLSGARAGDLQAISAVWGDAEGATRDRADRTEMERRLMIMVCHLRHEQSRIGPPQAGEAGRVIHRVELTQGERKASPLFTTVRNQKSGRWFVEIFEINVLSGWCTGTAQPPNRDRVS